MLRQAQRVAVSISRRGRQWEIEWDDRSAVVEASLGMGYLAALVANPGREIAAADLVMGPGLRDVVATKRNAAFNQPVLDESAKRAYRQRLSELDADIEELEGMNDAGRAAKARNEREWLIAELTTAVGLGGQVRRFATSEERARVSVSKAIWRALDRITSADPQIGAELRASVQTGLRCCYYPR